MLGDDMNNNDIRNTELFSSLVMMFTTSAMQQMGKLINPLTGKAEVNLEAAQWTIDILVMLREKMRGNLTKEEQSFLNDAIASLQLNYVETSQNKSVPESASSQPPGKAPSDTNSGNKEERSSSEDTGPEENKAPKFRKTYGS